MSIVSVFTVLLLSMVLGMVMNIGRQVNAKVRMQNTADAATLSGGVVLARGMNTLAFSNHLLFDCFSFTAFLREARDRNAESHVPEILAAWQKIGPVFARSGFPKFTTLGPAIQEAVPLEQEVVRTYSEWMAAQSELVLPTMEVILDQEMIPQFERAVTQAIPGMAQRACNEIARLNGLQRSERDERRGNLSAALWRTMADPVGGDSESSRTTLPVVDPIATPTNGSVNYKQIATDQRNRLVTNYLRQWNDAAMRTFDTEAKMCNFAPLWRSYTCGQLDKLLSENENRNLPFVIRDTLDPLEPSGNNAILEQDYMFVGVAYWLPLPEIAPGWFKNPLASDTQTFAQGMLFVPRPRLFLPDDPDNNHSGVNPNDFAHWFLVPGDEEEGEDPTAEWFYVRRQSRPTTWNLLTQNWNFQLVPATTSGLAAILQTQPPAATAGSGWRLPSLGSDASNDLKQIVTH